MISKAIHYLKNQPQGFMTLLLTETCTLFGFFGISSLLVLYTTNQLHLSDSISFIIYGSFVAFIYATPIIGGPIADKILGFRYSIYLGLLTMIMGNFMITSPNIKLFYIGLAFFAVGSGFFTPAFNTLVSKMYHLYEEKRDNAFTIYYMSKNLGGLFAIVICGFIANNISYTYAFLLCAVIMFLGLLLLYMMRKHIDVYINKINDINLLKIIAVGLITLVSLTLTTLLMEKHISYVVMTIITLLALVFIVYLYRRVQTSQKWDLLAICAATILFIVFGIFLGEGGTTLNLFIERIVDRQVLGIIIPPSAFYALDPLFMVLLGGLMMYGLNHLREKHYTYLSFNKVAMGLLLLALGFLIFAIAAERYIITSIKPSVLYVIVAYALFPLAELCIAPIVLSMTTKLAPRGSEAMMVGFYLVGYALGYYLSGIFSIMGRIDPSSPLVTAAITYRDLFTLSAGCLFVAALITYMGVHYYKRRSARLGL